MINTPQENPSSAELLDKAKKALTAEQYQRIHAKALEKIGIKRLISMSLEDLKSELPKIVSGDQEEDDIMTRLDREFPGIKATISSTKTEMKFTEHPLDWAQQKASEVGDWAYETMIPDRFKKVRQMNSRGASGKAMAATALGGIAAGEAVETAEKVTTWLDKFRADPLAWFKKLFEVLFSFDGARIRAFFSPMTSVLGISSDTAEKFARFLGVPKDVTKYAKQVFSLDVFGKIKYGDLSKIWDKFQKNPQLDLMGEIGIKEGSNVELIKLLSSVFGENNKNILSLFSQKVGSGVDISKLSMSEIVRNII